MSDYVAGVYDNTKVIGDTSARLLILSRAFRLTGNEAMEYELMDVCRSLLKAKKGIEVAVSEELNRRAGGILPTGGSNDDRGDKKI